VTGWEDEDREVEKSESISGVGKEGSDRQLFRPHHDNGAEESGMRMTGRILRVETVRTW
jgi:hypothetical protein